VDLETSNRIGGRSHSAAQPSGAKASPWGAGAIEAGRVALYPDGNLSPEGPTSLATRMANIFPTAKRPISQHARARAPMGPATRKKKNRSVGKQAGENVQGPAE